MTDLPSLSGAKPQTPPNPMNAKEIARLREATVELEASFLAEMLKAAGVGEMQGSFSGGTGEEQFSSFLRQEQARAIAEAGGIGLAEQVFENLKGKIDDQQQ